MDATKWSPWSPWSGNFDSITTYTEDEFFASIQLVTPTEENGDHNRHWIVKRNNVVIGSGFTLGTRNAEEACELYYRFTR